MGDEFGAIIPAVIAVMAVVFGIVGSLSKKYGQSQSSGNSGANKARSFRSPEQKPYNPYRETARKPEKAKYERPDRIVTFDKAKPSGHETGEAESVEPIVGSLGEVKTEGCFDQAAFRFISKDAPETDDETPYDYEKIAAAIVFGSVFSEPVGDKRSKF